MVLDGVDLGDDVLEAGPGLTTEVLHAEGARNPVSRARTARWRCPSEPWAASPSEALSVCSRP